MAVILFHPAILSAFAVHKTPRPFARKFGKVCRDGLSGSKSPRDPRNPARNRKEKSRRGRVGFRLRFPH
jgi:hypothetical protein